MSQSRTSKDRDPSPPRLRCTITETHHHTTITLNPTITPTIRGLVQPILDTLTGVELDAVLSLLLRRAVDEVRAA